MFWRVKSLHFKLLSLMPGGQAFYTFTQERVTGSTAATPSRVRQKVDVGMQYWQWLNKNGRASQIINGNLLDYGAGWHPTIPLLWHAFGNNSQLLVDIFPNMDAEKVTDTARYLSEIIAKPEWTGNGSCKRPLQPAPAEAMSCESALKPYGIRYAAPFNRTISSTGEKFDAIFCTQVLQHIDAGTQAELFREFHECLKPGGLILGTVHLVGQFRSPNLRVGQYQHLQQSPWVWDNLINSSLMSFNRLKSPHYRRLLDDTGLRTLEFQVEKPTPGDLAELERTDIHPSFKHLPPEDLAARSIFFVAEKP